MNKSNTMCRYNQYRRGPAIERYSSNILLLFLVQTEKMDEIPIYDTRIKMLSTGRTGTREACFASWPCVPGAAAAAAAGVIVVGERSHPWPTT